jgi:hypothetical protein
LGVSRGGGVEEKERRGFWQGDGLGLLLSLESNWKRQEEGSLARSPRATEREGMADLSPLIGFARRKGRKERERETWGLGCAWPKFKLNLNFSN